MNKNELRAACRDIIASSVSYEPLSESEKAVVKKAFEDGNTHANTANMAEEIIAREYTEYNKLSASEIMNRMSEISVQIRTLRAYILAYGRDWSEDMSFLTEEIAKLIDAYGDTIYWCQKVLTEMSLEHYKKRMGVI